MKKNYTLYTLLLSVTFLASVTVKSGWHFELMLYLIVVYSAVFIFIFERYRPHRKNWNVKKADWKNELLHLIISTALFDGLGKACALFLVIQLQSQFFQVSDFWLAFPLLFVVVIAAVVAEFLPYWFHRISHQAKSGSPTSLFLWHVHAIHHLPSTMNWFKTNWNHPLGIFINAILKSGPLLLFGFPPAAIFLVWVIHVTMAYVSHSNIESKSSWLDYVVITPQLHRFHHSKKLIEAQNYGISITFWDWVFGTYYNQNRTVEQVGRIQKNHEYPNQNSYWGQIRFPFTKLYQPCCCKSVNK